MSNSEQSGGKSKSRRRVKRRPRRNRKPGSFTPKGGKTSGDSAKPRTEESPSKKVFIYTYTIRKGG
jgi:hypothetical protein